MWGQRTLLILLLGATTEAFGETKSQFIDRLLLQELREASHGLFPPSWAYSNEGGVIRYAEIDLIGDDRNEIVYSRSTTGSVYRSSASDNEVYFWSEEGAQYVKLEGEIFLEGFHKKEAGKSLFLQASEGRNYQVGNEPPFTEKLVIQEVSADGVTHKVSFIDDNSNDQLREMWKASLSPHKESSIELMEGLGFKMADLPYQWISLKDYLSGKEWEDYDVNVWSALTEFTVEATSWRVHRDLISPTYLSFARHVRELQRELNDPNSFGIPSESINFPDGYLSPKEAYRLILEKSGSNGGSKMFDEGAVRSSEPRERALRKRKPDSSKQLAIQQSEEEQSPLPIRLAWILAAVVVIGMLALLLRNFKSRSAS